MSSIEKPCIKKCALNEDEVCIGCYRTFDDMRKWHTSTKSEKLEILKQALQRKAAFNT